MSTEVKRLNDYFTDWATNGGIFHYLPSGVPWGSDVTAQELGILYHGARSGGKVVSPFVDRFLKDDVLEEQSKTIIANTIYAKYSKSWTKLYDTLSFDYNPIENYDMTEEGDDSSDNNRTPNLSTVRTRTPNTTTQTDVTETPGVTTSTTTTRTPNTTTEEVTDNAVTDTESGVFGFDSQESVPSDNSKSTTNGKVTTSESGQETVEVTESPSGDNTTTTTVTERGDEQYEETTSGTESTTVTTHHKLTRHGNIGVTTSQQMIQAERNLWFWNFFEQVFRDIDQEITCPIY